MSPSIQRTALLLLATSAALSARAQNEDAPEPLGIRFRLAGRVQFNLKASFTDTQVPLSGAAGQFADGYVLLGSNTSTSTNAGAVSANPGSATWNWGYQRENQVAGNELTLTRFDQVPRVGTLDGSGGSTAYGGELWAMYELYSFRSFKKRTGHWGVEAGYGFTTFDASASSTVSGTATRRQSVYSLGGIVPPSAGYQGGYFGPVPGGPVAPVVDFDPVRSSEVPVRSSEVQDVSINSFNSLNAAVSTDLHTVKFGPWVELPVTDRLTVGLGAGFCTIYAQADLRFSESTTFTGNLAKFGGETPNLTVNASRADWRPGFYARALVDFAITPSWSVFAGGDIQSNSDLNFSSQGRGTSIQLGSVFGAMAGVQFKF
jgi:hypothetical protein